jgi:hypothetical protein
MIIGDGGEPMSLEKIDVEQWVFICPEHGAEVQVFCFRALDENLMDEWHLFKGTLSEINTSPYQRHDHQMLAKGVSREPTAKENE